MQERAKRRNADHVRHRESCQFSRERLGTRRAWATDRSILRPVSPRPPTKGAPAGISLREKPALANPGWDTFQPAPRVHFAPGLETCDQRASASGMIGCRAPSFGRRAELFATCFVSDLCDEGSDRGRDRAFAVVGVSEPFVFKDHPLRAC